MYRLYCNVTTVSTRFASSSRPSGLGVEHRLFSGISIEEFVSHLKGAIARDNALLQT